MQKQITRVAMVLTALTVLHPFEGLASLSQDAAARAAAVLAEVRQAIGGDEKIRNVKTLQASGDLRRSMGEMQIEGELELLIEPPDRMRRNESLPTPSGGTMVRTEVLNGDVVWDDSSQRGGMGGHMAMIMRGPGGREMSEEQIREMRRRGRRAELSRYMLAWLVTTDAPITYAGVAEAPDGTADVLEITPGEGPAMRLFVDRQTHLPLMLTWRGPQQRIMMRRGQPARTGNDAGPPGAGQVAREAGPDSPPSEATFEMRFDDYRAVGGIRLPHQITRGTNGSVNEEWTIKRYKVNAAFRNNTFTK